MGNLIGYPVSFWKIDKHKTIEQIKHLFVIGINELLAKLSWEVWESLYSDDLIIYYKTKSLPAIKILQRAINRIEMKDIKRTIICIKAAYYINFFSERRTQHENKINLAISGENIQQKKKLFGKFLDSRHCFISHKLTVSSY